jgi:hypothetical protein
MKSKFKTVLSSILFGFSLFLASCAPDDSEDISPVDDRDKYIGTWSCAENSSKSGASTFDVTLRKNSNESNQLLMDNFYLLGSTHFAVLTKSANSITISTQSISGNTVQGSGTIASDTKINLSYTVNDGSGSTGIDNCTAVLTKR